MSQQHSSSPELLSRESELVMEQLRASNRLRSYLNWIVLSSMLVIICVMVLSSGLVCR